ncbi:hypothetical protein [Pseudodesulfovibrio sediminis]|uniref:Uncharacterized protein n=1 Tax=Pseudodesulfovibrio sediminis TaxID=2810563 RepID=A0ABN6EU64_9BACT|nr:hypothetical protein [Pseudodesulfovibrio sediminis]BCS88739.1 hypothetical protein PSDVSF_19810 [Pseudodesulfovibrio sediminis]
MKKAMQDKLNTLKRLSAEISLLFDEDKREQGLANICPEKTLTAPHCFMRTVRRRTGQRAA